ncbi:insulin receptor substrate 1-B isoform X2 [Adelges cooleyi]|uniref:insulin receptor substrate 1-B isoform X2 n=1 Tax=Adelges cooleyi TaxID=133065 RepID=UPI00217F650D|nr:insulin receptor substrate 1-B isoform X2 [Adelges cooleyi]
MCFTKLLKMSVTQTDSPRPRNTMAGVVKIGYLKKMRSMRKKFFVLREETIGGPARLEYYESEKKWRTNCLPKRVIVLKTCFNIDKRADARNKNVLSLYTKDNYFCILFDTEKELEEWLDLMLVLQRVNKDLETGESSKDAFEHIWHISILKKELGLNSSLIGMTGLCLCDKKVTIMKYPTRSKKQKTIDIMLTSIRRCGALDTFFYMEVGQSSPLGAGHIWMDTWDSEVSSSIHQTIMGASSRTHDLRFRLRSSSFNEGSRMITCPSRTRPNIYDENNPGLRYKNNSQSSSMLSNGNIDLARTGSVRERCDSMPLRPRTISENTTSSTRSYNGVLSPKQTFHKGCNCVSSSSPAFNDSGLGGWDSTLSKSTDATDGFSPFYTSLSDQRSAILEEKQEDFISYTPLDREEDSIRQISDSNVNNNIHLINNNIVGNRSSSSSQTGSCCDSNSPYGSPINLDDRSYTPLNSSSIPETSPPPDGYLPMKPGFTVCNNYMAMGGRSNSKQDSVDGSQPECTLPEGYVPMAPMGSKTYDYVPMSCKQGSIESGTPSTDIRFSDIHLDKVCAYLTPSEDEGPIERPTRAYSVGSRPDGLREKIDKIESDRTRTRAFSVGSRGRLPPTGLVRNGYQSGSTSMSEQSDSGDRMEIDFSRNGKFRRHYSATCRNLSVQTPAEISPRSSPKLCPSPDTTCTHRSTGRSPPKSIASSVDIKRALSGAVHAISRSPPSAHAYLSPTLERVSEYPGVEISDSYTIMKPGQPLTSENTKVVLLEESNKRNYVNVWETSTSPIFKMLNWKSRSKDKKRNNSVSNCEQLCQKSNEAVDETDSSCDYTTIKPGVQTIPIRPDRQSGRSNSSELDSLSDELSDLTLSDQTIVPSNNSLSHPQSVNFVSSIDGGKKEKSPNDQTSMNADNKTEERLWEYI